MASTPVDRVRYLIGNREAPVHTPSTLSGGPTGIYSYRMLIARMDGRDMLITAERNSMTTNRHISACKYTATMALGLVDVGNETIGNREYTRYQYQGGL